MVVIDFVMASCHFYRKKNVATSWRYVHGNVMPFININKYKMVFGFIVKF